MFILTIDSNDREEIAATLKSIAENLYTSCIGKNENNHTYEYDTFSSQEWLYMVDFLHFSEDGNSLKRSSV